MSDEYQSIKVAAARAAVQASGDLEGIEGPYYAVGDEPALQVGSWWRSAFRVSDEVPHPDFAKVIITRKGQKPREVVISWDEYAEQMDADPEWDAIREKKPMAVFGGEAERHAYRVVFADVLDAAFPPRIVTAAPHPEGWDLRNDRLMVVPDAEPTRDWIAEVKVADAQKLNALYDEARAAGALAKVDGLQAAIMERTLDLEHPPIAVPPVAVSPEQIAATRRAGEGLPPKPHVQRNRRRRGKPRP